MKYLCLIYEDETGMSSNSEWNAGTPMNEAYRTFTDDIKKSGHLLGGDALQPTSSATTVRVRDGRTITSDGPFAETKEQLGGYYLIEGRDLNDAIQVAARIPSASRGSIEVRPIRVFGS